MCIVIKIGNMYEVTDTLKVNKHRTCHVTSSKARAKWWRLNSSDLFNFTVKNNVNILMFFSVIKMKMINSRRQKNQSYSSGHSISFRTAYLI